MKITPVQGPGQVRDLSTPEHVRTARAEAAFKAGVSSHDKQVAPERTPAQSPVLNQNAISVEELSAIVPPSQTDELIDKNSEEESVETQSGEETTAPVEEPKQDDAQSRRFAQLVRQEKQLRLKAQQQATEFKAKEAALAAREAALTQQPKQDLSNYISKDKLKSDFLSVAAEAGLTYDEITQQYVNAPQRNPVLESHIAKLEAKIASLEEKTVKSEQSYTEQQQQQYQAAVKQIEQDARALVKTDPAYEAIRATNSVKDIVKLITETHAKDGRVMTVEEAAEEIENHLVEEIEKYSRIEKIKKRMATANASPQANVQKTATKQTQPMKTLTNATSSTRQLSSKERAILAFEGRLKS